MYTVTLYSCTKLTDGCSSCLSFRVVEGFECGWCNRASEMADSCMYKQECEATLVTEGSGCPPPIIVDFNPKSGPIEGGTTITITGRDLGITFDDFNASNIRVGTFPCTPIQEGYASGREIQCRTTDRKLSIGALSVSIEISLSTGQVMSEQQFRFLTPEITEVYPILGPVAGGTQLTLKGQNLNIGNTDDTRITINERQCDVE